MMKSTSVKQPASNSRPQTQPNGIRVCAPPTLSGFSGDPTQNASALLSGFKAVQSCSPHPHPTMEQGGNREEIKTHKAPLASRHPVPPIHADSPAEPQLADPGQSLELHKLSEEHEKLIEVILEEEDQLIDAHKRHIDAIMELAKKVFHFRLTSLGNGIITRSVKAWIRH